MQKVTTGVIKGIFFSTELYSEKGVDAFKDILLKMYYFFSFINADWRRQKPNLLIICTINSQSLYSSLLLVELIFLYVKCYVSFIVYTTNKNK